VAATPEFVNVTSTDDEPAGVPAPITTVTVVAFAYVHVAGVPELGVAPTFAVHLSMKFVPVTVTVPPVYAEVGAIEFAEGLKITPDATPADVTVSASVCTVMPVALPAVTPPMVRPVSVTVTAVLALSVAVPVVMMIDVAVGEAALPVAPPFMATAGAALVAKKPVGYMSMILLPAASAPPAVVVNENTTTAPILPETRSAFDA